MIALFLCLVSSVCVIIQCVPNVQKHRSFAADISYSPMRSSAGRFSFLQVVLCHGNANFHQILSRPGRERNIPVKLNVVTHRSGPVSSYP